MSEVSCQKIGVAWCFASWAVMFLSWIYITEFTVGSQELAVNVEVQADEENDGDEE